MYYTDEDIQNMCRAFSKDYDTLSKQEKKLVRQEAEKWLKAYQEACPSMFFGPAYKVR